MLILIVHNTTQPPTNEYNKASQIQAPVQVQTPVQVQVQPNQPAICFYCHGTRLDER